MHDLAHTSLFPENPPIERPANTEGKSPVYGRSLPYRPGDLTFAASTAFYKGSTSGKGANVIKDDERLGTELLLKNDRIGVWEHLVPAGTTGHSHTHRRPYISVIVRGGKGETVAPSGEVLDEFDFTPGASFWVGPDELPATHALRNTGDEDVAIVTIELL